MNQAEFKALQPGQFVRHKASGSAAVVANHYGDHAIAVRTQHISNPCEWDIVNAAGEVISSDEG